MNIHEAIRPSDPQDQLILCFKLRKALDEKDDQTVVGSMSSVSRVSHRDQQNLGCKGIGTGVQG